MSQMTHNRAFAEAVWDTTPIIRMTCAELIGYCANITRIARHVYPDKVAQELQRQGIGTVLGQINRNGDAINDRDQAVVLLNVIHGGSLIFHVEPNPSIDICSLKREYSLDERDGEFWVIAYATHTARNNIVVVIDDGPVLNDIYREYLREARRFTIYTSLHIIHLLMEREQVIAPAVGVRLFHTLYTRFFGKVSDEARSFLLLDEMFSRITSRSFHRRFRPELAQRRPFYGRPNADEPPHWHWR